ncbi:MAG: glycosidase, partial [Chloroflexi bacterium]|nr:glycosidase [Chloroflexota bacterium]
MMSLTLTRYPGNPLLVPSPLNAWETDNVFNAAMARHNGLIYMHYRAQGLDRISRIGCAIS